MVFFIRKGSYQIFLPCNTVTQQKISNHEMCKNVKNDIKYACHALFKYRKKTKMNTLRK